jgi:hypothetical protein
MRSSKSANRAGRDADGAMSEASLDLYLARSPVAFKVWQGQPIEAAFPLAPAAQQILFGWKSLS